MMISNARVQTGSDFADYGYRRPPSGKPHTGIDIGDGSGGAWDVLSPIGGRCVYSTESPTFWPYVVVVLSNDGYYHRFAHLSPEGAVSVGDNIWRGKRIGRVSSSTENEKWFDTHPGTQGKRNMGGHLHYEISTTGPKPNPPKDWPAGRYRDPAFFLKTGFYARKKARGRVYPMRF